MKPMFDKVLQGVGILTFGLMGLAVISLGYLFSWVALQIGIGALLGLLILMTVIGFVESAAIAIILAPFRSLRWLIRRSPPQKTEPTPENEAAMLKFSKGIIACFCIGIALAAIQFLIGGLN